MVYRPPTPDPSPAEIVARCAEVQATWDARAEQARRLASVTPPGVTPPGVTVRRERYTIPLAAVCAMEDAAEG